MPRIGPIYGDAVSLDDQIRAEIVLLETEVAVCQAALKVRVGPLVEPLRQGAVDIIARRRQEQK
jgi:hypothetical protein